MMIKDLEMSKDLDRDALSAVRGGNAIVQNGIIAPVSNASGNGFSFASPTSITSAPVSVQTATLNDNDLDLDIATKTANVVGSLGTFVWQ
jgi:hypothetical protein